MNRKNSEEIIKGYCSQCSCYCPTISFVKNGRFVRVEPDWGSSLVTPLCPKGEAGPELVYNQERLQYPMRRTRPKGDPDPGWKRITWDEALDSIVTQLKHVKATWGPEAVAIARCGPAGSPMSEVDQWVSRFAHAFGTPNTIATTHICQWHRDVCSSYTYGKPGSPGTAGRAEFERAGCILIWGNNTHATRPSLVPFIKQGLERATRLIVIDPRKTEIAAMADLWLQVCPGADGVLALSMINVMIEENLYDYDFVRDWTTAPFLVRSDTGNFLKASDLTDGGDSSTYVMVDSKDKSPMKFTPGMVPHTEPVLDTTITLKLAHNETVECTTAFRLLRELASEYPPTRAEKLTWVPAKKIRDAARLFTTKKPACWYSWNGVEQSTNASQTNRAICILYALTGDYDRPGGNVILPTLSTNPIDGREFLSNEANRKRLGAKERPIGPAGVTRSIQAYEVYKAIFTGKPYPIKALVGFGGNLITSNAPTLVARDALEKLDLHVQAELFLSPSAELADIVLPVASFWESWHVRTDIASQGTKAYLRLRPAVVSPQHESWSDMKIIFEMARRLGLGDRFWEGNVEAAFDYQFAPTNTTVEQLRMNSGVVSLDLTQEYQKYNKKDESGKFLGFATPSKRVELYSQTFKDHGYNPLPVWEEPIVNKMAWTNLEEKYPLILTGSKVIEYCHSQQRVLPSLRKRVPHPFLEINPQKAKELGCKEGDWVILETPFGSITLQTKVTEGIHYNVVCTQNGWWQACPELNLPAYDSYSPEGANVNLLYSAEEIDPISGSLLIKGYPCNVKKKS
jgi:anaerobic selenocysteine-containing dehydrogenase